MGSRANGGATTTGNGSATVDKGAFLYHQKEMLSDRVRMDAYYNSVFNNKHHSIGKASIVQFDPSHNICCVYDEKLPKMVMFKDILEFMKRLPIQKALTNQHKVFKSHIAHFWKNVVYDAENDVINSSVSIEGEDKPIIITEHLVREVLEFPDDENSPTGFPERMVKGCMLRMGYNGPLNKANYLKACFTKPYKFFIHSVIHALSHRKGGYDVMKDYQMCMVTALVLNKKYNFSRIVFHYMKDNITSGSKSWVYPRFVQMMLDHAYPNLVKDEQNDLVVLNHMDNETLIRLSKYHKNWPEPKTKTEFFGFIKSANYEDPDPVNHLKWRNDEEMKEKNAIDELAKLEEFVGTRNDWYTKEDKKKRGGKRIPKVQTEEGSSSQTQKKRKKKTVETMLVDEPEEDETEENVEKDQERLSPETEQLLKSIDDTLEAVNPASQKVVGDEEKSLSDSEVDAEVDKWIKENYDPREKEKQKKRKRSAGDDDESYVPEENVQGITPPSSGGRKKSTSRKRVQTPAARKLKFKLKKNSSSEPQQPPSPPPQQPLSDPLQSPSQLHTSLPIHEQPQMTTPHIQQTPPPIQTTPGSSGFGDFPHIPESSVLESLGG
ncbi:putative methyltransferase [Helianthus debilis subsp. tardiflorus]